jgi:NADH:ubiquinone oxidoreductase subunit 4 (subunit M)
MDLYAGFLSAMAVLFVVSAGLLLVLTVVQVWRKRGRRAAAYLALTLLACGVAAGFYFFRGLI